MGTEVWYLDSRCIPHNSGREREGDGLGWPLNRAYKRSYVRSQGKETA